MSDELTRPLGLSEPDNGAVSGRLTGLVAALSLVLAVGLGGAAAWFYYSPEQPSTELATAPGATISEQQPEQSAAPQQAARQPAEEPEQPADNEPGPNEGLVEIDPDGGIAPKVPVPVFRRQEAGLAHLPDPELIERVTVGAIPQRSSSGLRPMDAYSRPPATEGNFGVARVAIIVGGLGISQTSTKQAIDNLPPEVTLAYAPYGNSLGRWMQTARRKGHEILLQVPMEPFDFPRNNPGPHTLTGDAKAATNIANLHWAMSRITNYVGVVNFLGGSFLGDEAAMKPVFDEISRRGLLLIDDGSTRNSRSDIIASRAGLPFATAQVQIDALRERRAIAERLDELAAIAKRTGLAIGVASAFPDSVAAIAQFARNASQLGIEMTPVSAVVDDPERGD